MSKQFAVVIVNSGTNEVKSVLGIFLDAMEAREWAEHKRSVMPTKNIEVITEEV